MQLAFLKVAVAMDMTVIGNGEDRGLILILALEV
jgi:hypothetical protein